MNYDDRDIMPGYNPMKSVEDVADGQYTESTKLPAIPINLARHPLLAHIQDEKIQAIREEAEIDAQLGLKKQINHDSLRALQHDIDQLTSSRDYIEVNLLIVEKLFQLNKLRRMCWPHNAKEYVREVWANFRWMVLFFFGSVGLFYLGGYFNHFKNWVQLGAPLFYTAGILSAILSLVVVGRGTSPWLLSFKFNFLRVILKTEFIEDTNIPIPLGAKLKLLEAKNSGIFSRFKILWPDYKIENVDHQFNMQVNWDPAIVGITADNRMYMIVSWDVASDIEKTASKIKLLKKYKLEGKHKFLNIHNL